MDNERRRFIKGGIAIGLLMGSGALLFEGTKDIATFRAKDQKQKQKAELQTVSKGKTLDLNTYRSELEQIQAEEGVPAQQAEMGLGKMSLGIGTGTAGSLLVKELAETPNIQSSIPANTTE